MNCTNFSILTSFRRRMNAYHNYTSLTILFVFRAAKPVEQNSVVPLARASKLVEAPSAETNIFYKATTPENSNHISNEWYVLETTESIEPFVDSILSGCRESIHALLCRNLPTNVSNDFYFCLLHYFPIADTLCLFLLKGPYVTFCVLRYHGFARVRAQNNAPSAEYSFIYDRS